MPGEVSPVSLRDLRKWVFLILLVTFYLIPIVAFNKSFLISGTKLKVVLSGGKWEQREFWTKSVYPPFFCPILSLQITFLFP